MANTRTGNTILIDSTGAAASAGPVKVTYIMFTPAAANDTMILRETATGADKLHIAGAVANQTTTHRFPEQPITFVNGIFVQSLHPGAKAVLVTTTTGG